VGRHSARIGPKASAEIATTHKTGLLIDTSSRAVGRALRLCRLRPGPKLLVADGMRAKVRVPTRWSASQASQHREFGEAHRTECCSHEYCTRRYQALFRVLVKTIRIWLGS